jgi:hypothetical protein
MRLRAFLIAKCRLEMGAKWLDSCQPLAHTQHRDHGERPRRARREAGPLTSPCGCQGKETQRTRRVCDSLRLRDNFSKSVSLPSRERHHIAVRSLAWCSANITCPRVQIWSNHKNPALATRRRAARPRFGRSRMPDTAVQEIGISKEGDARESQRLLHK